MAFTLTWTESSFPGGNFFGSSIIWAETLGLFVVLAVGNGFETSVFTSVDGITWINVHTFTGESIYLLVYSPDIDTFIAKRSNGDILASMNLISWSTVAIQTDFDGGNGGGINHLVWDASNAQFLALPSSSMDKAGTSVDGFAWTFHGGNRTDDPNDGDFGQVLVGLPKLYWSISDSSAAGAAKFFSSTDGISWTLDPLFADNFYPVYGDEIYVQDGHYYVGGQIDDGVNFPSGIADYDGATWTFLPVYLTTPAIFTGQMIISKVSKIGTNYVIGIYEFPTTTSDVWTSDDGATWTLVPTSGAPTIWGYAADDDGLIVVMIATDGSNRVISTGAAIPTITYPPRPPFTCNIRRVPGIAIQSTNGQAGMINFKAGENDASMPANPPAPGQDLQLNFNDGFGLLAAGTVLASELTYEDDGETDQVLFNVLVADYRFRLNRRRPFGCSTNESWSSIVLSLIDDFANPDEINFTGVNVDPDLPAITIEFDGSESFTECLDRGCEAAGCKWDLDNSTPTNISVSLI